MFSTLIIPTLLLATLAASSPVSIPKRELAPYTADIEIHASCNVTQRRQLEKALADTWELASFAKEYIQTNGPQDPVYQLYFGSGDYVAALGSFDGLLSSNKAGVLLRCDDPDGNCHQPGWRGHHRGSNGTLETVICDLSYVDRKYNEQFCALGYTVAEGAIGYYWATDLIHRLFHVPTISDGKVSHYADTYEECLELAAHNGTYAPYNTHSLQYFANHVYGMEVAAPGVGCTGNFILHHDDHSATTSSSSAYAGAAGATASAVAASTTASAALACHTHADGVQHCE